MQIDWIEVSKQGLGFFLGLMSGVSLTLIAHYLSIRREQDKAKNELLVFTELSHPAEITVTITNVKSHSVSIVKVGVDIGKDGKISGILTFSNFRDYELPIKLEGGEAVKLNFELSESIQYLMEVNEIDIEEVWVMDSTRNKFITEKYNPDYEDFNYINA